MNDRNNTTGGDADYPDDCELTPEEKRAMEALPRDLIPSAALENRVVGALRASGFLHPPRRRVIELTARRAAMAAAAGIVLILCGFALGEWVGARRAAGEMYVAPEIADISTAATVQRAGSAYLTALQMFAALPDSADGEQAIQGREAALTTLYAAADQAARLVPKNELVQQLLTAIGSDCAEAARKAGGSTIFEGTAVIEF